MNNQSISEFKHRSMLSSLWIFAFLNMIFRDIHEFFRPGFFEQFEAGMFNGTVVTDELLLIAGITLQIPLLMVILVRLLPTRINRWVNICAAIFLMVTILANGANDMDDVWFFAVIFITMFVIIWQVMRRREALSLDVSVPTQATA